MLSLRRKRVHGAETDLQAVNGGNGMCNYPVSNIQYPLFNDGGANWILAVGCWIFAHFHIQQERSNPLNPLHECSLTIPLVVVVATIERFRYI